MAQTFLFGIMTHSTLGFLLSASLIILTGCGSIQYAAAAAESSNCVPEFDNCVLSRDCCDDLACVMGDWAVTTDSTCLSERSVELNTLSKQDRLALIYNFYKNLPVDESKRKSRQDVQALVDKYAHDAFAHLVAKIEKRYNTPIDANASKDEREGHGEL